MANFYLGINAKMYYGAAALTGNESSDVTGASWTEASNVRNVNLDLTAGETDVTTRANTGWRANAATLKEMTATFEMVYKDSDAFLAAIKTAFLAGSEISMLILTGANNVAGHQGPAANFTVTNFSRTEDLEGVIIHNVTLKASSYQQWYVVAS